MLYHLFILLLIFCELLTKCNINLLKFLLKLRDTLFENLFNLGHNLAAHGLSELFLDYSLNSVRGHIISLGLSLLNDFLEEFGDLILYFREKIIHLLI